MRGQISTVFMLAALVGCEQAPQPDAYGNVEATTITVGAEAAGRLLTLSVSEGQTLRQGEVVGTVDAEALRLEREQFAAQENATSGRLAEIERQIEALDAQRASLEAQRDAAVAQRTALVATSDLAQRSYDRISILFGQQAATVQQRDQAERDLKVAEDQIRAQDQQIKAIERQMDAQTAQAAAARAQKVTIGRQVTAAAAQVARAAERVSKAEVRNPKDGTVHVTYARAGEIVQVGQSLYNIADLSTVDVRAYVSETQLASIQLGQAVRVSFDRGSSRESLEGSVTWIASQAEFTPTPIQTRDERTDLVYAFKVSVPNGNGALKIGMPVDVSFAESAP
jgi:HlyD family secretion protein